MSRLIRLPELLALTSSSRSSIHRLEAAGQFPQRRRIGTRAVAWSLDEVEAWMRTRPAVAVNCADAPTGNSPKQRV